MMANKPIDLKPIDIEHKFNLNKLQHKTQFMTKASTAFIFYKIETVHIFRWGLLTYEIVVLIRFLTKEGKYKMRRY